MNVGLAPFPLPDDGSMPPLPAGAVLDQPSAHAADASALPPLPPGATLDTPIPDAQTPTVAQFADEMGPQVASRMAPEDDAHIQDMIKQGATADELRAFAHAHGGFSFANADQVVAAYAKTGQPNPDSVYQLAAAPDQGATAAFSNSVTQGATLGTSDEIHGFLNGVGALVHGGSYSDTYDHTVDQDRAQLGADSQNHGVATFVGNLAGGALMPLGLEKSGLTASLDAVALAAGKSALREGLSMAEARTIAARAVTRRMATEGAAYVGADGAGSADGGPGQRLLAGVTGAVEGAAGGLAAKAAGQVLAPVGRAIRGGVNAVGDVVDRVVSSVTPAGAQNRAAGLLRDAASGPTSAVVDNIRNSPESVSGARPTLAEVSGDAGLAHFQQRLASTDPVNAPAIAEQHSQNAALRMATANNAMGDGLPQDVQNYAAGQVGSAEAETAAQRQTRQAAIDKRIADDQAATVTARQHAEQAQASAREAIGPAVDRAATSEQGRNAFSTAYKVIKARVRAAYNDPRLDGNEPVDLRPHDLSDHVLPDGPGPHPTAFRDQAVQGANSALPPRAQSLLQFVRARGGVDASSMGADDLRASSFDSRSEPGFLNSRGPALDNHLEAATEAGFVPEGTRLPEFIDHLTDEKRGISRLVRSEDMNAEEDFNQASNNRDFWRKQFAERHLDPLKMSDDDWAGFHNDLKQQDAQSPSMDDYERQPKLGSPMGPFHQTISALRDQFYGAGGKEAPAYVKSFFDKVMNSDVVGIKTLEGWESQAHDLAGTASDRTHAAALNAIGSAIGGKAIAEGGPARAAALSEARALRRQQGRIFETGDASKAFGTDRYGNPTTADEVLPTKLVRPGAAGGDTASGLSAAIGSDNAESVVRQELRRQADVGNVTSEAQATALSNRYREAAQRFPSVQRDLQALQAHGRTLDDAKAAEAAADKASATADEAAGLKERSAFHDSIINSPIEKIANEAQDPASFIARSLTKGDGGREIARLHSQIKNNPEALAGMRRSFGDYIERAGGDRKLDAAGNAIPAPELTRRAINTVVARAGAALEPQQKIVLKAVGRELEKLNFANTAVGVPGSSTSMNINFVKLMSSASFGPHTHGVKILINTVLGAMNNGAQVRRLVTRAIQDPDFAATLLKRPTPKHWVQIQQGMAGRKVALTMTLAGQPAAQRGASSALAAITHRAAAEGNGGGPVVQGQQREQNPPAQRF